MTTLPPDLLERWHWRGPFLTLKTQPNEVGLSICSTSFPPPVCFEKARWFNARHQEREAAQRDELPPLLALIEEAR